MVRSDATSSAAEDTAFAALRRAIVRAKGFTLLLAVCNRNDRRERLMQRLSESLPSQLNAVTIDAECTDVLERVLATVGHDARTPIAVSGLDAGIDEYEFAHPRLASLNQRREDWRDLVPVPVIFWIPEYLLRPLARGAPDFLDWRVGTFFFLDDPVVPTNVFRHLEQLEVWRLNAEERQQRIGELRDLIQRYSTPANENASAIIRWRLELARQLVFIGEIGEAEQLVHDELLPACRVPDDEEQLADAWATLANILQQRGQTDEALRIRREECTPRYERLGDVGSKAATMGQIADILQQRGEIYEALRIYREECIPVFERLGNVRAKAATMGHIAGILQRRGETDEALRIYRLECIPVFERLGDVQSKAMTMGHIAGILQQRGEIDEALRIYRLECIPVFERLGDVMSKGVTMGKIADILQQRGQIDEAIRIRREEQLPVFERLGDVRAKALTMGQIADILMKRGEIHEAIRIYRETLEIFGRLRDEREQSVCRYNLALALLSRGYKKDIPMAHEYLRRALATAEKHQYAEAAQLRQIVTRLLGRSV